MKNIYEEVYIYDWRQHQVTTSTHDLTQPEFAKIVGISVALSRLKMEPAPFYRTHRPHLSKI